VLALYFRPMNPVEATTVAKKVRVDGNMTGLAGELFVAAELLKRGLQTSITFGNAKQIDLFAHNPDTGQNFTIQVKTLRAKNYFPIRFIHPDQIYVFVVLNRPSQAVQYYIVSGQRLAEEPESFDLSDQKFPGIYATALAKFEGAWKTFGC
jgi:hypothetical protein